MADSASAETVEALTDTAAEPASLTAGPPDAAATPADSAVKPADTAVEPIGTVLAPTETAGETEVPALAPSATVEALTDTPPAPANLAEEPTDAASTTAETAAAPAGTAVELTAAALRSILDAPLSVGLGGAIDTTLRASADTSNGAALAHSAEIAQPAERELTFPLIAPSHVQALNAVYRRRPALAATIGGRQTSIVAAWPPPDRRPDASHRVALRIDGESGELWLPQSLLDILVDSVDPVLSLDRLGPDRAAIILEFALDSVLAAVERNLGCKLAIDFIFGPGRTVGRRWTAAAVLLPL